MTQGFSKQVTILSSITPLFRMHALFQSKRVEWDAFHQWADRWFAVIAKGLGLITAFIVIVSAIYGGVKYVIHSETSGMANDVASIKNTLQPLPEAIHSLENRMTKMEAHWDDLKLQLLSQQPASKETAKAISEAVTSAKNANRTLDQDIIERAGERLLASASKTPAVWDAALTVLAYRTFLNANFIPFALTPNKPLPPDYKYGLAVKPPASASQSGVRVAMSFAGVGGDVSEEDSARVETLERPNKTGSGYRYIIIEGRSDTLVLDGEYLKNVIVRNAVVEYDGGRTRLENVYFINCEFHFRFTAPAKTLGNKLLAAATVSFTRLG